MKLRFLSAFSTLSWRTSLRPQDPPVAPSSESSSLGRDRDFFSARRIRTCSRTLLAFAPGSRHGPSDGTTYAVQDDLGCRADRKHPSDITDIVSRQQERLVRSADPLRNGSGSSARRRDLHGGGKRYRGGVQQNTDKSSRGATSPGRLCFQVLILKWGNYWQ